MSGFEYKVVPAPMRGLKARGVKGTPARFANALQTVMNEHGAEGWEYQRTDTLPVEERKGLTGKTTTFQNMLVFRRALTDAPEIAALIEHQSEVLAQPDVEVPAVEDTPEMIAVTAEDFVGDAADTHAEKSALTLDTQNRVTDTLKAPFAFPWNRRVAANTSKDDSGKDSNIPAE